MGTLTRCYNCDNEPAVYEASINGDSTPIVKLCLDCAAWERSLGDVRWIRTLHSCPFTIGDQHAGSCSPL